MMVAVIISVLVLAGILWACMLDKEELSRHQQLKNKRRFGGKRLSAEDQAELDRLSQKYWWH